MSELAAWDTGSMSGPEGRKDLDKTENNLQIIIPCAQWENHPPSFPLFDIADHQLWLMQFDQKHKKCLGLWVMQSQIKYQGICLHHTD